MARKRIGKQFGITLIICTFTVTIFCVNVRNKILDKPTRNVYFTGIKPNDDDMIRLRLPFLLSLLSIL